MSPIFIGAGSFLIRKLGQLTAGMHRSKLSIDYISYIILDVLAGKNSVQQKRDVILEGQCMAAYNSVRSVTMWPIQNSRSAKLRHKRGVLREAE
jgi:hypothetical protein